MTTGTVAVSATASSGLAVTFTSLTTDLCTVSAATATLLRSGTCTLQASQDGDQTYSTATPVVGSFEITKDPTPIPTPTPTPTARTTLKVKAKPSTTKLRAGRSTTVVKRVTSNGKKVLKAKCTVGTKRIKRVCDIRIKRNRIRVGNGARVVVTPSCSDNVSATVKVIAKKQRCPPPDVDSVVEGRQETIRQLQRPGHRLTRYSGFSGIITIAPDGRPLTQIPQPLQ